MKRILPGRRRLGALAVIVAAGALAVAAWGVSQFAQPDKSLVKKSFAQIAQADTFRTVTKFYMAMPEETAEGGSVPLVFADLDGGVRRGENGIELAGDMAIEVREGGKGLYMDGDVRLLHDAVALKFNEVPVGSEIKEALTNRWTYVPTALLKDTNNGNFQQALDILAANVSYVGIEELDGKDTYRFRSKFASEDEQLILTALQQGEADNPSVKTITKILTAFDIDTVDLFIDRGGRLREIKTLFALPEDKSKPAAVWSTKFSDYDKPVDIDRPPQQLTVKPELFNALLVGSR